MTNNQKKIFRLLKRIYYPIAALMIIYFLSIWFKPSLADDQNKVSIFLHWLVKGVSFLAFTIVAVGFVALIQQFYLQRTQNENELIDATDDKILMKLYARYQFAQTLMGFLITLSFLTILNILLFQPTLIFEAQQVHSFGSFEKIIFGIFYLFTLPLVLISGVRLCSGLPPYFIATEKGFCYQPAAISTGWILWEDVEAFGETTTMYRNPAINAPDLKPALGIKLTHPKKYNDLQVAPLFKKITTLTQSFNNYQTEGVGDIMLNPSDFGKDYDKVVALFKERTSMKP